MLYELKGLWQIWRWELHALAIVSTRVSLKEPSHPFTSFIQASVLPSTPSGVDSRVCQNQLLLDLAALQITNQQRLGLVPGVVAEGLQEAVTVSSIRVLFTKPLKGLLQKGLCHVERAVRALDHVKR